MTYYSGKAKCMISQCNSNQGAGVVSYIIFLYNKSIKLNSFDAG